MYCNYKSIAPKPAASAMMLIPVVAAPAVLIDDGDEVAEPVEEPIAPVEDAIVMVPVIVPDMEEEVALDGIVVALYALQTASSAKGQSPAIQMLCS